MRKDCVLDSGDIEAIAYGSTRNSPQPACR